MKELLNKLLSFFFCPCEHKFTKEEIEWHNQGCHDNEPVWYDGDAFKDSDH